MTKQPALAWSVKSGEIGTISGKGLYTAPANKIGSVIIHAVSGTIAGTATISVVPSGAASYVGPDTTTQGNWQSSYGADGYDIIGAAASFPTYATVTPTGESKKVWSTKTTSTAALSNTVSGRTAAEWYAASTFAVNVNVKDGQTHQVALYFLDWANAGLSERVDVLNSAGQVIGSQTVSGFSGGVYEVWNISGNVTFRITKLAGSTAVLSGLFFGAPKNNQVT
jgi:hypothetical protein